MDDKWLQWRLRTRTPASAVDVPVHVVYDAMVKEVLSPGFRELGLRVRAADTRGHRRRAGRC